MSVRIIRHHMIDSAGKMTATIAEIEVEQGEPRCLCCYHFAFDLYELETARAEARSGEQVSWLPRGPRDRLDA